MRHKREARFLWAYGLDHGEYDAVKAEWYVKDMPLSRLDQGGVLLAYAVSDEPLAPEHGFPLRLVIPGYYGTNSVKWLWRLELAEERAPSPFTTVLYNDPDPVAAAGATRPVWEAPPEALIVAPAPGPLAAGRSKSGVGPALRPASRRSRSVSMGRELIASAVRTASRVVLAALHVRVRPSGRGNFLIAARATHLQGAVQPKVRARNAVHSIAVTVE